ncbi:MAG: bifunctional phosphopantothenoylcysteine decarboxylase/phosphopantothenate--cysteine ligase CoaBC [Capsulimonadaceae bacterium]
MNTSESKSPAGPRVVLGVTGSIAAYKGADLASKLVGCGYTVYPVLTRGGAHFVSPTTFAALCGNPCPIDGFDDPFPGRIAHIWLAQTCDAVVIAPASMNVIARLAHGLADDMLTAIVMATEAPVLIAPAMNSKMWSNPATQENIATLRRRGYHFVEPATGRLACRTEGVGKLADVPDIVDAVRALVEGTGKTARKDLAGMTVLVTAGPTREAIDPVRYLTNRSSGKMGYALAERAAARGAKVVLVSGPTALSLPPGVILAPVVTALEMEFAVLEIAPTADLILAVAAVADYRPAAPSSHKIKKGADEIEVTLVRNPDILANLGRRKQEGQILVGFAAETDDLLQNAEVKLHEKNLDWIVANDVTLPGSGFEGDTNSATLLGRDGACIPLPLMPKTRLADVILDHVMAGAGKERMNDEERET